MRRAKTVYRLDDPTQQTLLRADPARILTGEKPILVDEWQLMPQTWDLIRRAVDENPAPNQFLLTGSAAPVTPPTHSGAGRIVRVRMRLLSLAERGLDSPTVSLQDLLTGEKRPAKGGTTTGLREYTEANVKHLRTKAGRQEIDLIIERADHRIVAVEVKLTRTVTDDDVKQLLWLQKKLGDDLLDSVVITTGPHAYRRKDGIAVVPAALLGP